MRYWTEIYIGVIKRSEGVVKEKEHTLKKPKMSPLKFVISVPLLEGKKENTLFAPLEP